MKRLKFIGTSQGSSMAPLINPSDKLFVKNSKLNHLSLGDIIVFYQKGKLISHRIVTKRDSKIITKGDNSPFLDSPLTQNEIIGKAVRIEGKYGILCLESKIAKILSIYFLVRSLAIYYIPFATYRFLTFILRGRKSAVKLLVKQDR